MEQAARASMGKSTNQLKSPTPIHLFRPTVMEVPFENLEQQPVSKFKLPQTSTSNQWQGARMPKNYTDIPATSLDLSQFDPSPYNFEKDQQLKRKLKPEPPKNILEEIRPIKLSQDVIEEVEIKTKKIKQNNLSRCNNMASDGGPIIGAWMPLEKKPEILK